MMHVFGETIFHYCSTETFHSIVKNRSLWLSSLLSSNDTLEGKMVTHTIRLLAMKAGFDRNTVQTLCDRIDLVMAQVDSLGLCLSREGDLLSQWRGYAADASGLSIGFNRAYLEELASQSVEDGVPNTTVKDVVYTETQHFDKLAKPFESIAKLLSLGALKPFRTILGEAGMTEEEKSVDDARRAQLGEALYSAIFKLIPYCFDLKAAAFLEEREVRLHRMLMTKDGCEFRTGNANIIPYQVLELKDVGRPAIVKVFLGPKHQSSPYVIRSFLWKHGFMEAEVVPSAASYR